MTGCTHDDIVFQDTRVLCNVCGWCGSSSVHWGGRVRIRWDHWSQQPEPHSRHDVVVNGVHWREDPCGHGWYRLDAGPGALLYQWEEVVRG